MLHDSVHLFVYQEHGQYHPCAMCKLSRASGRALKSSARNEQIRHTARGNSYLSVKSSAARRAAEALRRSADAMLLNRPYIKHVANEDEECFAPVELAEIQNSLFS